MTVPPDGGSRGGTQAWKQGGEGHSTWSGWQGLRAGMQPFSVVKGAWQTAPPPRGGREFIGASARGVGWDPGTCVLSSALLSLPAIRPEGKNNRLFVFSISMASVAHWSLDVAADSQEELQDWVKKIREVAQTADARVRACWWPSDHRSLGCAAPAPGWEQRKLTPGWRCGRLRMC